MWKVQCWYHENRQMADQTVKILNWWKPAITEDRYWTNRLVLIEHLANVDGVCNSFHIRRVHPSNDPNDMNKTIWEYQINLILNFLDNEFLVPIGVFEYKEQK